MTYLKLRNQLLYILNIFSYIAIIIVNALANIIPLNGYTTGEVANLYPNLFTPAPITFSIWFLIYFLLGAFILYQAKTELTNQIGYLFFFSALANITWIIAWHYLKIELSFIIMLFLLTFLIMIYKNLEIGKRRVNKKEKHLVYLPFSLYTGWITVATLANLTVLLVDLNLYGTIIPAEIWTLLMIIIATIAGVYIYSKRKDIYYSLAIIWALLGIIIKRIFIAEELLLSIVITALLGIILIIRNIYSNIKN